MRMEGIRIKIKREGGFVTVFTHKDRQTVYLFAMKDVAGGSQA